MIRTIFIVMIFSMIVFVLPANGEVFISGNFLSMAAGSDGSVYLLSDDNQIVKVQKDGTNTRIKLPPVPEIPDARFSDLTINDSNATFCSFQSSNLYSIDIEKPEKYSVVESEILHSVKAKLLSVCTTKNGFRVIDADERVFEINHSGETSKLAENTVLFSASSGESLIFKIIDSGKPREIFKVTTQSGKEILERTSKNPGDRILSFGIVGFDYQERLVFFEDTGAGDKGSRFMLLAAKDDKILASRELPGTDGLMAVRSHVLMPDGSICIMRLSKDETGVDLSWITL
ncbi:MAG: hypothetical protein HQM10_03610 [Candidatus Riflebacteria bacterium]|nr:hypothetical protein [Candidatus Riflebacteria bacterium]